METGFFGRSLRPTLEADVEHNGEVLGKAPDRVPRPGPSPGATSASGVASAAVPRRAGRARGSGGCARLPRNRALQPGRVRSASPRSWEVA